VNVSRPSPLTPTVHTDTWDLSGALAIAQKTPVGRVGRPEDIAECYLWLLKDANVTGFVACSDAGSKLG